LFCKLLRRLPLVIVVGRWRLYLLGAINCLEPAATGYNPEGIAIKGKPNRRTLARKAPIDRVRKPYRDFPFSPAKRGQRQKKIRGEDSLLWDVS
jgi:hypothetical protein